MQIINLDVENIDFKENIALCLGFFDGIHLGHIELLKKAKESIYKSAVLTFVSQYKRNEILTSLEDKIKLFSDFHIDYLFLINKLDDIKNYTPQEFIERVLMKLNAKEVIVGEDYFFGKERKGNVDTLNKCSAFQTFVIKPINYLNQKISSSLINAFLDKGEIDKVNYCLNREYVINAKVVHGKGNGHKINYPTANLELIDNYKLPRNGVYKGYLFYKNKKFLSMINVGIHPSIDKLEKPIVEVHIVDESINLYDKIIKLAFTGFIRFEVCFSSLEALKEQLDKDKKTIKDSENEAKSKKSLQ